MVPNKFITLLLAFLLSLSVTKAQDKLIDILDDELKREMDGFKNEKYAPYYLAYRLNEIESATITSSFGTTINVDTGKIRICYPSIRIGNYDSDNTHGYNEGHDINRMQGFQGIFPIEDEKMAIAQTLWRITENAYQKAVQEYTSNQFTEKDKNDTIPDFTREKPVTYIQKDTETNRLDCDTWQVRLNNITETFNQYKSIVNADAAISYQKEIKYFVSSEGTKIKQTSTYCHLHINGMVKASDGMICPLNVSYFGFTPDQLPKQEKLMADVKDLINKLYELKDAPLAEPYEGPAILSAKATGVFFHEIFGHRTEGHRVRQKSDGQTFKDKINEHVLPVGFNVTFDPTIYKKENFLLSGYYKYDDEGIPGQKVNIVEDGKFKGFLMSRCPIDKKSVSNGHGRAQPGSSPVTRQSNMLVSANKTFSDEKLRKQLIKECKKQNKPYGYLFEEVSGGFTQTNRFMPNAFNVSPLEVYKIYVDGRPDELVRGVSLIGTPLAMFAEIQSAGAQPGVFNGFCGAESGSVPVATIAPSVFVKQIETQKQMYVESTETVLERPHLKNDNATK